MCYVCMHKCCDMGYSRLCGNAVIEIPIEKWTVAIKLQILLAVLSFALKQSDALTCLLCTDASAPRNCGRVKKCGSHEVCYIDEFINSAGYLRYDVGCRDSQFCTSSGRRSVNDVSGNVYLHTTNETVAHDVVMRSSSQVKVCESCCNNDLCNIAGCKATGIPSRQTRGPICYTCAKQQSAEQCDVIAMCGIDSVCKVKLDHNDATGELYYSSTCENAQLCHQDAAFQNAIVGRKRTTEEVDTANNKCVVKCCDDDLCNGVCGTGSVSTGTGSTGHTNPCLSNPCVYGTCSASHGTYVCTCTNGAQGRHCDLLPTNPCFNHPCQHGQCHTLGSTYQCHCNHGYSGTNCDQGSDPCQSPGYTYDRHHNLCYKLHDQGVPWSTAKNICENEGAMLAVAATKHKWDFLKATLSQHPTFTTRNIWIGGLKRTTNDTFYWVNGDPVTFNDWGQDQPNRLGSRGCIALMVNDQSGLPAQIP